MAVSEDLIYTSILELARDVSAMRAELTGFVATTNSIKAEVSSLRSDHRADMSAVKAEIQALKDTDSSRKNFVGGMIAVASVVSSALVAIFTAFIWPYLKDKIGI